MIRKTLLFISIMLAVNIVEGAAKFSSQGHDQLTLSLMYGTQNQVVVIKKTMSYATIRKQILMAFTDGSRTKGSGVYCLYPDKRLGYAFLSGEGLVSEEDYLLLKKLERERGFLSVLITSPLRTKGSVSSRDLRV